MTKHVLDTQKSTSKKAMFKAFSEKEIKQSPSDATLALQRRAPSREPNSRMQAYTRIDSGKSV